jgi:hypothetical protein
MLLPDIFLALSFLQFQQGLLSYQCVRSTHQHCRVDGNGAGQNDERDGGHPTKSGGHAGKREHRSTHDVGEHQPTEIEPCHFVLLLGRAGGGGGGGGGRGGGGGTTLPVSQQLIARFCIGHADASTCVGSLVRCEDGGSCRGAAAV